MCAADATGFTYCSASNWDVSQGSEVSATVLPDGEATAYFESGSADTLSECSATATGFTYCSTSNWDAMPYSSIGVSTLSNGEAIGFFDNPGQSGLSMCAADATGFTYCSAADWDVSQGSEVSATVLPDGEATAYFESGSADTLSECSATATGFTYCSTSNWDAMPYSSIGVSTLSNGEAIGFFDNPGQSGLSMCAADATGFTYCSASNWDVSQGSEVSATVLPDGEATAYFESGSADTLSECSATATGFTYCSTSNWDAMPYSSIGVSTLSNGEAIGFFDNPGQSGLSMCAADATGFTYCSAADWGVVIASPSSISGPAGATFTIGVDSSVTMGSDWISSSFTVRIRCVAHRRCFCRQWQRHRHTFGYADPEWNLPDHNHRGQRGVTRTPTQSFTLDGEPSVYVFGWRRFLGWRWLGPRHPVTTSSSTSSHGYWLVGSDGGIFTFGSAQVSAHRPASSSNARWWASCPRTTATATGSTPPTAGSSPSVTPASTARSQGSGSTPPVRGCPTPQRPDRRHGASRDDGKGTSWWPPTAASLPSVTRASPGLPRDRGLFGRRRRRHARRQRQRLLARDATGNVYTFGDAPHEGAPGNTGSPSRWGSARPTGRAIGSSPPTARSTRSATRATSAFPPAGQFGGLNPATAVFATSDGGGYWVVSANGTVENFGDAPNDGGMNGTNLNGSIIAATGF